MKRIPIGISDFKTIIQDNYLFVDKSMLIKEFFDSQGQTVLLPRPRRFGKTLNMSMLKYFFTKASDKEVVLENRKLFSGLEIEKHEDIMALQGQYPVMYLSFKDQKHSSFEKFSIGIKETIGKLYDEHIYLKEKNKILLDSDKEYFSDITSRKRELTQVEISLERLSKMIYDYYKQKVIILIDEYDVPIQSAYMHGYYDEAIEFMRNLFSGAFKDNIYLEKAMITGILRVSKESIFSGLNNLKVESILSYDFSDKFGFTEAEVEALTEMYNAKDEASNIKAWYNGYYFGDTTIYNPWSILNYLANQREGLKAHWVNTSSNDLVNVLLSRGGFQIKQDLESLIKGESITKILDENIVMSDIEKSSDYLWSFLLFTGYLKATEIPRDPDVEEIYYKLEIPNREVKLLYKKIISRWYEDTITKENYVMMLKALLSGDIKTFQKIFRAYVLNSISYFDVGKNSSSKDGVLKYEGEKVYHAFVLGMLISISDTYEVLSNRESGYGRYDVCIIPRDTSKLGIIIEFKKLDEFDTETVEELAVEALAQIEDKKYSSTLEYRGVNNILKLAIVFKGKEVYIKQG